MYQVKREHIPIKIWCFSLRDSSDEDCISWIKEIFSLFISFFLRKIGEKIFFTLNNNWDFSLFIK